jgi:hypothetical protein
MDSTNCFFASFRSFEKGECHRGRLAVLVVAPGVREDKLVQVKAERGLDVGHM